MKVIFSSSEKIGAMKNMENLADSIDVKTCNGIPAIRVTRAALKPSWRANFLRFNSAMTKPAHAREPIQPDRPPFQTP